MTDDTILRPEAQAQIRALVQIDEKAKSHDWLKYGQLDGDLDRLLVLRRWSPATPFVTHIWYRETDSYEHGHYLETSDIDTAMTAFDTRLKELQQ